MKNIKQLNIILDTIWTTFGRIGSVVFGLLINIVIAREFSANEIGEIAIINSFLNIITIFTVFGSGTSILKLIPEYDIKYSILSSYYLYNRIVILSVLFSIMLTIFIIVNYKYKLIDYENNYIIFIASFIVVFNSVNLVSVQALRAIENKISYAVMQLLPQLPNLIILIVWIYISKNQKAPFISLLLSIIISGIFSYFFVKFAFLKKLKDRPKKELIVKRIRYTKILKISWPMLLTDSSFVLMSQSIILILGFFVTNSEIGMYSVAVSVAMLTNLFIKSINSVISPKISRLFISNDEDEIFSLARKGSIISFVFTLPVTLFLILFGKTLIKMLFGVEFSDTAYFPMIIISLGQLYNSACGATASIMNMTGYQNYLKTIMIITVFINIIFGFLLVSYFGIIGAAIATTLSVIFWNTWVLIFIKKKHNKRISIIPF